MQDLLDVADPDAPACEPRQQTALPQPRERRPGMARQPLDLRKTSTAAPFEPAAALVLARAGQVKTALTCEAQVEYA